MPFAACQSNSFTSTAPFISSCLFIILSVLLLSDPFLDLWDFGSCDGGLWGQRYATPGIIPWDKFSQTG